MAASNEYALFESAYSKAVVNSQPRHVAAARRRSGYEMPALRPTLRKRRCAFSVDMPLEAAARHAGYSAPYARECVHMRYAHYRRDARVHRLFVVYGLRLVYAN